jgi:hypothetical protein
VLRRYGGSDVRPLEPEAILSYVEVQYFGNESESGSMLDAAKPLRDPPDPSFFVVADNVFFSVPQEISPSFLIREGPFGPSV